MSLVPARGFTIVELLVGTALGLVVAAGTAVTIAILARASAEQPRTADEQQRVRAALDGLTTVVSRAGEGLGGSGANRGVLLVPALYPHRRGVAGADPDTAAFDDRLTVLAGTETGASAGLVAAVVPATAPIRVDLASCAPGRAACGFPPGARALIADSTGTGEWFSASWVEPDRLEHVPAALSTTYQWPSDTVVTGVEPKVIAFDPARRQLRLVAPGSDLPWLDEVADFRVAWFGEPRAPRRPAPPAGAENCLLDGAGNLRLADRAPTDGPWVALSLGELGDGPWCGHEPWRFDADLYRVRLVRLSLRLRRDWVPDGAGPVVEFDIAPINLVRGG